MSLATASLVVGCGTVTQDRSLYLGNPVGVNATANVSVAFPLKVGLSDELAVAANLFSPRHRLLLNTAHCQLGLNSLMAFAGGSFAGINNSHAEETSLGTKTFTHSSSHQSQGYVGLPYQDHNYVAPYPCSPPISPVVSLASGVKSSGIASSGHHHVPPSVVSPLVCDTTTGVLGLREVVVTTTSGDPGCGNAVSQDVANGDDSITRCICDFQHDDGYMICCDQCGVWQHVDCMRVDRENIPDSYLCELCQPRHVDKHRAIQIQTRKRDDLSLLPVDSSATETEDETTQDDISQPVRKKKKENDETANGGGQKRCMKRWSKDESPKKKTHLKTHNNGTSANKVLLSPQKPVISRHLSMFENIGREEVFNGFNGSGVTPTEALFAAVECVTAYEDSANNIYSPELQTLLSNIRFSGQSTGGAPYWSPIVGCAEMAAQLAREQPCRLAPVGGGSAKMGLEATEDIITHQPLIEYVGNVMLHDQFSKGNNTFMSAQSYVLFYTKLDGLDLCVDARTYGNEARFVRRSCTPNAEVRHVLDGNTVRFFLHATKSIIRGAEITIPFDFNYHKCSYFVECACTRISCPVAKYQRRELNNSCPAPRRQRLTRSSDSKVSAPLVPPEVAPVEQPAAVTPAKAVSLSPAVVNSKQKRPAPLQIVVPSASLQSASVQAVEVATHERETTTSKNPISNPSTSPAKVLRHGSTPASCAPSLAPTIAMLESEQHCGSAVHSDSDEGERTKKKTREEKKLEAILKTIERMEKREERKKEALARQEHTRKHSGKDADVETSQINTTEMVVDANEQKFATEEVEASTVEAQPRSKSDSHSRSKKSRHCSAGSRRASMSMISSTTTSVSVSATLSPVDSISVSTSLMGDDASQSSVPHAQVSPVASVTIATQVTCSMFVSISTPIICSSSTSLVSGERLMRPPKKLMMRDHDIRRESFDLRHPLTVQTDCPQTLDMPPILGGGCERLSEFMPCVPSPHSHTLSSLRRASASAGGSAKKRWLQKAMHETTTAPAWTSPAAASLTTMSTSCHSVTTTSSCTLSPSVGDFVTPLKKRRLARESMSIDDSMPGISEDCNYSSSAAATQPASYRNSVVSSDDCSYRTTVDEAVSDLSVDGNDDIWSRHIKQRAAVCQSTSLLTIMTTSASSDSAVVCNRDFKGWSSLHNVAQEHAVKDEKDFSIKSDGFFMAQTPGAQPYPVNCIKVELNTSDGVSPKFSTVDCKSTPSVFSTAIAKVESPEVTNGALTSRECYKSHEMIEPRRERSASGVSLLSVSSISAGGDDLSPTSSVSSDMCNRRTSLSDLIRQIATPKLERQLPISADRPNIERGVSVEKTALGFMNGWSSPGLNPKENSEVIKNSMFENSNLTLPSSNLLPRWRETTILPGAPWCGFDALSQARIGQGLEILKGRNLSSEWSLVNPAADRSTASLVADTSNTSICKDTMLLSPRTFSVGEKKAVCERSVGGGDAAAVFAMDANQSSSSAVCTSPAWCSPSSECGYIDKGLSVLGAFTPLVAPASSKKKVSLLEYRQRKFQKSGDVPGSGELNTTPVRSITNSDQLQYSTYSSSTASSFDSDTEQRERHSENVRHQRRDSNSNDVSLPQDMVLPTSLNCEQLLDVTAQTEKGSQLEPVKTSLPSNTS